VSLEQRSGDSKIALTLAAIFLAACARTAPETKTETAPLVEIVAAEPAARPDAVRASGLVGYKRETELSFQAPGVVAALAADEGDSVARGQRLGALRRTNVGTNAAEAALARETAQRQLARTQLLYDRGFVSQAALDDARLAVERARDSAILAAPAAGIILRRLAEPAQTVNAGQPVLILGETESGLVVRAAFAAQAAARIRIDDKALVRVADGVARDGTVARIAAKSDLATGAFEVEVRLDNADGLRSGEVAQVEIGLGSRQSAVGSREAASLIVPTLALLDARADQGVVFVVDARNVARRRSVRVAGLSENGVLVTGGLNPGERVVAAGAAYVRDGEPVRVAHPNES
jgi:RND family efflux transporter MFP subunit